MEVEAKLTADRPSILDAIARRRRLGSYELRAVGAQALETVYLDAERRDLLRRRRADSQATRRRRVGCPSAPGMDLAPAAHADAAASTGPAGTP
jgi:hypothetical protein